MWLRLARMHEWSLLRGRADATDAAGAVATLATQRACSIATATSAAVAVAATTIAISTTTLAASIAAA